MARRRKGSPVHGWVVLDKPKGVTSTQAVSRVRRFFDAQKAGHAGTLDPFATGLLVLLAALLTGAEAFGFDVAMLAAIGSIGAIILSRRGG